MSGIGLGTYAYFWRHCDRMPRPMSLEEMLADAAALGAEVFQICDYPAVEAFDPARLDDLAGQARDEGVTLELGTRGVGAGHLGRYLELAVRLGARLVRSMITEGEGDLSVVLPAYADAGVTIALETYEKVPTADLVALVARLAHPSLGICLDPANSVAALEHPDRVVDAAAPYVVNLHVKDFGFGRDEGWVGFRLAGRKLGEGQLDLARMFAVVRPAERGISRIVEHWLPWQGGPETTAAVEDEWTRHNLAYLRSGK